MARILIVGGGCRGRQLASELIAEGHAVRITTRSERGRAAIESLGAECWIGTPDRLATLRGSLDGVAIACWLLGTAAGGTEAIRALFSSRLELFLTQAIDTTVRGVVYEARGTVEPAGALAAGAELALGMCERNRIPALLLDHDPADLEGWLLAGRRAVDGLLSAASR